MVDETLIALARFSSQLGFIGIDEYIERCQMAFWLDDQNGHASDPRDSDASGERREASEQDLIRDASKTTPSECAQGPRDSQTGEVEFWFQGWVFTKSDPDPYPSTPHGHWRNPNAKWPKLNPYTGRVFKGKHQEDISQRLSKREMKKLWNDDKFRDFCRGYILWYVETFPHHLFGVTDPLRFPHWR
jgi:hypothetical protein